MCDRSEVSMPTTKGENEREFGEQKERQASEVQQNAVCTNVGMKRHTYRHMIRNTHTAGWHKATHPQLSLLPGVAALLKHQG